MSQIGNLTQSTTIASGDEIVLRKVSTNSDYRVPFSAISSQYATAAQGSLASSAVQPTDDLTTLSSGTTTSGYVPQADGSGNVAWGSLPYTPVVSIAQFTSTDTTTNINQSTETAITWDTTLLSDSNITVSGTQITVGTTGIYKCYVSLAMHIPGTDIRTNPAIQFRINGVIQSPVGLSGYIRNGGSGDLSSSSSIELYLNLSTNDVIEVVSNQNANTGTVNLIANESILSIEKTGGRVPISSNTLSAPLDFGGHEIENYTERKAPQVVNNAGTYTIDLSRGRFFPVLLSANATIAFTNVPTTGVVSFVIVISQNATGGYSITWPTNTKFSGGTAPTPSSAANSTDTYFVYSSDNGTTWYLIQSAKGWA